jgi:hypothetical protein
MNVLFLHIEGRVFVSGRDLQANAGVGFGAGGVLRDGGLGQRQPGQQDSGNRQNRDLPELEQFHGSSSLLFGFFGRE